MNENLYGSILFFINQDASATNKKPPPERQWFFCEMNPFPDEGQEFFQ
jgi:hypothetical protein